jgi:adrenodoxin-NADP+ reductase
MYHHHRMLLHYYIFVFSHFSPPDAAKSVEIRFLLNPTQLAPNESNLSTVGHVVCERTRLEGEPGKQRPVGTGEMEKLPADLVLVSIGYRGMPLEGMEELGFFDSASSIVKNNHGKLPGENNLFVTGWIKRGPTGIIGTNIMDAKETVNSVMKYLETSIPVTGVETRGREGLNDHLSTNGVEAVDWNKFLRIVSAEIDTSRLRSEEQPREKILSVSEMLKAAS